jgi:hypothetical protein
VGRGSRGLAAEIGSPIRKGVITWPL